VVEEKNNCGCTDYCVKIMTVIATVLFIVFIGTSIGIGRSNPSGASACTVLGIISLVVSITGCSLLYCSCCKPPKGGDE
jgi:hypothetical protein